MFYRNSLDPALVCCEVLTLARCVPCVCGPGRLYWNGPSLLFTGHLVTLNIYTTPIHHPHLCAPARGRPHHRQYQTLSISRLWKLYFVPSASRDHFWQHLRLKLQLKVKTKKRRYETLPRLLPTIERCTDFSRKICQHQTFNSEALFLSLTMMVESLVMGWRLETFLPGAHQINKAPLSTFLGTSSYHHYNFILQPWSDFLPQPSWAGLSHGCLYYGEHLMDLSYFNWNLDWEGFENNFLT